MEARHSHPSTIKSHSHQDAFFSGSIEKGLGSLEGNMGFTLEDGLNLLKQAIAPKPTDPATITLPTPSIPAPAKPDNTMKYVKMGGIAIGGIAFIGLLLFGIRKLTHKKA
jgi:hypothetical protein